MDGLIECTPLRHGWQASPMRQRMKGEQLLFERFCQK
jgi:hypothetical protein